MADDDGFDDIVNNQPDKDADAELEEGEGSETVEHIMDAIRSLWPHFYDGYLIKGIFIAEYMDPDGGRVLRFITSPELAPWDMLGFLESARLDAQELSQGCTIGDPWSDDDDTPSDD